MHQSILLFLETEKEPESESIVASTIKYPSGIAKIIIFCLIIFVLFLIIFNLDRLACLRFTNLSLRN